MLDSPVAKIKERLGIEEVVSSYIKLEKAGTNLKARCPFHNEKTPSFFVSPERGSYYCFGCASGGDIFTFVEEFEGLDFKGALKILAEKAGVTLGEFSQEKEGEKERLYKIMEEATKFFEKNLVENPEGSRQGGTNGASKEVLEYLKLRGLTDKTIQDFRIGYIKNDWRLLYAHLQKKGFTEAEMEKAGLVKKTDKGFYDRFRGRIMFPLSDTSGRVIAFSGRIFPEDGKSAKYLNSPDTPIFKKSSILYGLDKAKKSIKKNDFSIVVEGQFDLILSHQAGFRNTVATSGTALAESGRSSGDMVNNLGVISRLSQNIVFIFDSDQAGFNASIRATPIALALFSDMNVKATRIPEGMDPADLISQKGPEAWREVIRNSRHIIEFLLDRYISMNENNDGLKNKLEIDAKIIPYVALINNPVKKSHFVSLISNKSGISEEDIRVRIKKVEEDLKYEEKEIEAEEIFNKISRKDYILRKLLGIFLWQRTLSKQNPEIEKILPEVAKTLNISPDQVLEKFRNNTEDLIFEAEVFYREEENLEKDVKELLNNFKEEYLKEELSRKMRELNTAETEKDLNKSNQVLKEISEINSKIQDIKNGRLKQ